MARQGSPPMARRGFRNELGAIAQGDGLSRHSRLFMEGRMKPLKMKNTPTRAERIDALLRRYSELDEDAEREWGDWLDSVMPQFPGVPRGNIEMMELTARSHGLVHRMVLERLLAKVDA